MKNLTQVWDPLVRIFHWSLVLFFAIAWLTGDELEDLHIYVGYVVLSLIGFRIVWGFIGGRYARFSQFVKSPQTVISYLKDMAAGREKRYLGHNPAGGAMILILLIGIGLLGLTGWMYTTDMFWGAEWVEEIHEFLANALLLCVALHIAGVLLAGSRHKENLVKAMITGKKEIHD